jgi:hypothetical protein
MLPGNGGLCLQLSHWGSSQPPSNTSQTHRGTWNDTMVDQCAIGYPKMTSVDLRQRLEVIVGILWFLLDGMWMLEYKIACAVFCVLLFFAINLLNYEIVLAKDSTGTSTLVSFADTSWVTFNISWALGDMFNRPDLTSDAKMMFIVGGVFFIWAWLTTKRNSVTMMWNKLRIGKFWRIS